MSLITVQCLGSGDAFNSGGRLHSCFLVGSATSLFLLDCGASALVGIHRYKVNPNDISVIFITHLHGDHYGGIPFFLLDAMQISNRKSPLWIAGPPGIREYSLGALETLFPGSGETEPAFPLEYIEFSDGHPFVINDILVLPLMTPHPPLDCAFSLRVEFQGKVIAYSSDTEWSASVLEAARGADLFLAEAYTYQEKKPGHLDFVTLNENLPAIDAKRVVTIHMGESMLSMIGRVPLEAAEDGKIIEL